MKTLLYLTGKQGNVLGLRCIFLEKDCILTPFRVLVVFTISRVLQTSLKFNGLKQQGIVCLVSACLPGVRLLVEMPRLESKVASDSRTLFGLQDRLLPPHGLWLFLDTEHEIYNTSEGLAPTLHKVTSAVFYWPE